MVMVRVRFAPSPTGYLHVGGARTALFNWLFARHEGGTFVLRIEDTDVERSSEEMVAGILDSMRWLGLDWDEGPYYQSQRLDRYREFARQLLESGFAYRCFCSPESLKQMREEAQRSKKPFQYPGTCRGLEPAEIERRLAAGSPFAIRFRVPENASTTVDDMVFGKVEIQHESLEDFVLLRSDGHPTYHLSVVVDDIEMKISHVIRGADHLSNTPKQILLYRAAGAEAPKFAHVPLILGPDKSRLSKRHGATSVSAYRDLGFLPEAFRNFLALLGWSPPGDSALANQEKFSTQQLIGAFGLDGIGKTNAVFNLDKAWWLNAEYVRTMGAAELEPIVRAELGPAGLWQEAFGSEKREWFLKTISLLQARARSLKDFVTTGRAYFSDEFEVEQAAVEKNLRKDPSVAPLLAELAVKLGGTEPFTIESSESALRSFAEEKGVKAGLLINGARTVLTGSSVSPGIFDVMAALGKERVVARLRKSEALIAQ